MLRAFTAGDVSGLIYAPAMCGRYASYTPPAGLLRWFRRVGDVPNMAPTWNLAPTQGAMMLRRHPETGERSAASGAAIRPALCRRVPPACQPRNTAQFASVHGVSGSRAQERNPDPRVRRSAGSKEPPLIAELQGDALAE
jgi:putative SOS response-associated peptidase YedK